MVMATGIDDGMDECIDIFICSWGCSSWCIHIHIVRVWCIGILQPWKIYLNPNKIKFEILTYRKEPFCRRRLVPLAGLVWRCNKEDWLRTSSSPPHNFIGENNSCQISKALQAWWARQTKQNQPLFGEGEREKGNCVNAFTYIVVSPEKRSRQGNSAEPAFYFYLQVLHKPVITRSRSLNIKLTNV